TDCVKQAGGSVSALQKRGSVEPTGEQIELEADAVVVGAGASGMGAALASAQSGARVIVLEKNSNIGGNCLVSGGYLEYLSAPDAARPEMTEELHRYVEEVLGSEIAAASDPAIVEKVRQQYEEYKATGSSKLFDSELFYSLDIAVTSGEGLPVEVYMPLAHNLSVLNDWMTELNFSWATPLHPITGYAYPRWSNPTEGICGEGYFDFFDTVLEGEGLGVEVMLATAAQDLITEGGSVVGVTACAEDGTIYTIRTPKVILASGGFSGNPDLLREYNTLWDYPKGNLPTTNVNGHTGDGITLARKIGAQVKDMDNQMLFPFNDPITFSADNVAGTFGDSPVVNEGGKRFVDETTDRFTIAAALMKQTNSMCYFISDSESVMFYETSPSEETLLRRGQLFKGNTLEELGQQMGCDPKEFAEELKRFNDFVAAGNDTDFGRYIFSEISAVDTPPFYAAPATWAAHITIGGLDVDETNFAVRNENGSSIPGLYACGEVRNSICGVASIADGVAAGKAIFTR
ncbi:MAG: FAD-dependent oxidoreductase, partial [Raoultibacter sp.]